MKKLFLLFLLILPVSWLPAQHMNLDTIIEQVARDIEEILPQGTMVAVLNFSSPTEEFSDYVLEELTGQLVSNRRITIVDRQNFAFISQEMNLQLSGYVSDESAQAIGRMLGAQSIVSGTLTNMGSFHRFRVRVINVETAAIQAQISFDLRNDSQVAFLLSGSPTTYLPSIPEQEIVSSNSQFHWTGNWFFGYSMHFGNESARISYGLNNAAMRNALMQQQDTNDLFNSYRKKNIIANIVGIPGGIVLGAGLGYLTWQFTVPEYYNSNLAIGLTIGGAVFTAIGEYIRIMARNDLFSAAKLYNERR